MAGRETKTDLGTLKIHSEVISSIASMATLEVEGVLGLAEGGVKDKIFAVLGKTNLMRITERLQKNGFNQGIRVNSQEDEVRVDVSLNVRYGVNIPLVSKRVQENVKRAIEEMTGLGLTEVNVSVHGVEHHKVPREAAPLTE